MLAVVVRDADAAGGPVGALDAVGRPLLLVDHQVHAQRLHRRKKLRLTRPLAVPPHAREVLLEVGVVLLVALPEGEERRVVVRMRLHVRHHPLPVARVAPLVFAEPGGNRSEEAVAVALDLEQLEPRKPQAPRKVGHSLLIRQRTRRSLRPATFATPLAAAAATVLAATAVLAATSAAAFATAALFAAAATFILAHRCPRVGATAQRARRAPAPAGLQKEFQKFRCTKYAPHRKACQAPAELLSAVHLREYWTPIQ